MLGACLGAELREIPTTHKGSGVRVLDISGLELPIDMFRMREDCLSILPIPTKHEFPRAKIAAMEEQLDLLHHPLRGIWRLIRKLAMVEGLVLDLEKLLETH